MHIVHFLLIYIPFWAIPALIILGEFAYIYWLKSFKKFALFLAGLAFICFVSVVFYYMSGGGQKTVYAFEKIMS